MRKILVVLFLIIFSNSHAQDFTKEFSKFLIDHSFKSPEYSYRYDKNDMQVTLKYSIGTPDEKGLDEITVQIDSLLTFQVANFLDDAYGINEYSNTKEVEPLSDNAIVIVYKGEWYDTRLVMTHRTAEMYEKSKGNLKRNRFFVKFIWWELEN